MKKIYNWNGIQCRYDRQGRLVHAYVPNKEDFFVTYGDTHVEVRHTYYTGDSDWCEPTFYGDNGIPQFPKWGEEVTLHQLMVLCHPSWAEGREGRVRRRV